MNRRGFLGSLAALAVAPFVPTPATVPAASLAFHPSVLGIAAWESDAFALTMEPLKRYDCLYGFATIRPQFACRIVDDEPFAASENYRKYLAMDAQIQESLRA